MGSHHRVLVLVCVALLAPASASAQSNDPAAGSPSGSIYEIPLEGARSDAAPTGTPAEGASPIRGENGFGSSSTVPGAERSEPGGDGAPEGVDPAGAEPPAQGEGADATPGGQAGGGRSPAEADVPEGGQARGGTSESSAVMRPATGTSPSVPRALLLLGLGLLVAVGLAAGVRMADRRA